MTTIQEPGFETVDNWTFESKGSGKSGGQTTYWKTEGARSYYLKIAGGGVRHYRDDYAGVKQQINIDSDFTLRFDYVSARCGNVGRWDLSGMAVLRIKIDSDIIADISLPGYWPDPVYNKDVRIAGYSGQHTLHIQLVISTGWVDLLHDNCVYIDNIRIINETPHPTPTPTPTPTPAPAEFVVTAPAGSTVYVFGVEHIPLTDYYFVFPLEVPVQKTCTGDPCTATFTEDDGLTEGNEYYLQIDSAYADIVVHKSKVYRLEGVVNITITSPPANIIEKAICSLLNIQGDCRHFVSVLTLDLLTPIVDGYTIVKHKDLYSGQAKDPDFWTYFFFALGCVPILGVVKDLGEGVKLSVKGSKLARLGRLNSALAEALENQKFLYKIEQLSAEEIDQIVEYAEKGDVNGVVQILSKYTPSETVSADVIVKWDEAMGRIVGAAKKAEVGSAVFKMSEWAYSTMVKLKGYAEGVTDLLRADIDDIVNRGKFVYDDVFDVVASLSTDEWTSLLSRLRAETDAHKLLAGYLENMKFLRKESLKPGTETYVANIAENLSRSARIALETGSPKLYDDVIEPSVKLFDEDAEPIIPDLEKKLGKKPLEVIELLTKKTVENPVSTWKDTVADYIKSTKIFEVVNDVFGRFKNALPKHNPPVEIGDRLLDLKDVTVVEGEMGKQIHYHYTEHVGGVWGFLKRHSLAVGIAAGWIFVMGPWATIDNVQWMVYLLRRIGVIPRGWGDQWDVAVEAMEDAYYALNPKTGGNPCLRSAQQQYVYALENMKALLEGAKPIPADKLDKAIYSFKVIYGLDIGDPNEELKRQLQVSLDAWTERYFHLIQACGCEEPVIPKNGWVYPQPGEELANVKVSKVIDGDTIEISSEDIDWPADRPMRIRLVGINAPEGADENYKVRRQKCTTCKTEEWLTGKDVYNAATNYLINNILDKAVTIRGDKDHLWGSCRRYLGVVIGQGNVDINKAQLSEGNAAVYFLQTHKQVDETAYLKAESEAKDAGKGIWKYWYGTGTIHCVSHPTGAEIYLDGEDTGHKTVNNVYDLKDVIAGKHTVRFEKYIDSVLHSCEVEVTVDAGRTVTAECTLVSPSPTPTATPKPCPTPTASYVYSPTTIYAGDEVTFDASDSKAGTGHTITEYAWYISGTKVGTGRVFTYRFSKEGSYIVKLEVKNDCGNTDTKTRTITVKPAATPTPTATPTPAPTKGIWHIKQAVDENGNALTSAKIYVDDVYVHHYTPEDLVFCSGCKCDTYVSCEFGTHTVTVRKSGYSDWSKTRTIKAGDEFTDTPVLTAARPICTWIDNKGGPTALTVSDIFELVDAYLGVKNIGFTPTTEEIFGCVDYFLGFIESGNSKTGCSY